MGGDSGPYGNYKSYPTEPNKEASMPDNPKTRVIEFTTGSVRGAPKKFFLRVEGSKWIFDLDRISAKHKRKARRQVVWRKLHVSRAATTRRLDISMMIESLDRRQLPEFLAMSMVKALLRDNPFMDAFLQEWKRGAWITLSVADLHEKLDRVLTKAKKVA